MLRPTRWTRAAGWRCDRLLLAMVICGVVPWSNAPFENSASAADISPDQIEQLQKAAADARATRESLKRSLGRAQAQVKSLTTSIDKLKIDLDATSAAAEKAEQQLKLHAADVKKYEEQKAVNLAKAADEAKARQQQAAKAIKAAQDKVRAGEEALSRLKSQKMRAESQAAEAAKSVKPQQDLAAKAAKEAEAAKQAADAATKKAAEATKAAAAAVALVQTIEKSIVAAKAAADEAAAQIKTAQASLTATAPDVAKARAELAAVSADAVDKRRKAERALIALGRLESFSEKVAPILVQRCLACHDAKTAKGRLNLETFGSLMRGGESGAAIVPGKSGESNLVTLIEDGTMPQDADPLKKQEIAVIRKWIDTGAILDAGLSSTEPLIAIMPTMVQPPAPVVYRVPIPVTAVAFSPNGGQLATSGYHEVIVWNPNDGSLIRRITNVAERVYAIQYSPDGKLIAVAAGTPAQLGEVKLFNAADGSLVGDFARAGDAVFAVAFSPNGKRLAAGGADRSIRVFDVESRKQQLLIEDHADWVMDVAWLPDGSKLVSASRDKTAKVFDASTGDSLVTFNGHGEPVFGVGVAPDGKTALSSGRDKSVRRWNIADGKEVERITGYGDEVFRLAVTADGRLFTCSADKTARLHALKGGRAIKTFSGHTDWVYSLGYCDATKRLATGSFDGEIRVWNVEDGKTLTTFVAAPGYRRPVATAAIK